MTTTMHQQLMTYVLDFIDQAGDGDWDYDFMIQKWNAKENDDAVKQITQPEPRKSDKIKDPNKPKRGRSAYIQFCADERPAAKAALVDPKPTEVTAELGRRWNALKDSKKPADKRRHAKYVEAAVVDKQRYDDEMVHYVPPSGEELELLAAAKPKRGRKSTKPTGDDRPKRGKSSYLFFCAANRAAVKAANPDMSGKEATTELGRLWQELKVDDEREDEYDQYAQQAADDKARYEAEMAALGDPPAPKAKKAKKAKAETDDKPPETDDDKLPGQLAEARRHWERRAKPKTRTAYHCFCDVKKSEVTADNPDMTKAEVRKELTAMWKELTTPEKATHKR